VNLIQEAFLYRGLPPIEATEAVRQAAVWNVVGLDKIPEHRLVDCFAKALQAYDPSQPFGAAQIRQAWGEITEGERGFNHNYCDKCKDTLGVYWDPQIDKFRCCECSAGRMKAQALWAPRQEHVEPRKRKR
jgi:hypothetical protein